MTQQQLWHTSQIHFCHSFLGGHLIQLDTVLKFVFIELNFIHSTLYYKQNNQSYISMLNKGKIGANLLGNKSKRLSSFSFQKTAQPFLRQQIKGECCAILSGAANIFFFNLFFSQFFFIQIVQRFSFVYLILS